MPPSHPLPPHPATIAQPKRAPHPAKALPARPPHPATVQRRSTPHGAATAPKRVPTATAQRAQAPTGAAAKPAKGAAARIAFLVDDSEKPGDGQVRKSQFLAALRAKVTKVAGQVLAAVDQTPDNCPYIPYWFTYYEDKDAEHVEQAIHRYAPDAATAKTWQDYVDQVADRVKLGFEANVANGSMDGVPRGIPRDLEAKVTVQRKAAGGTIQMCGNDSEKAQQKAVSDQIDRDLKDQGKRLRRWREVVPMNETREIVFRKLSGVDAFDPSVDGRRRPIDYLNFEQNEAVDGISLSRNPEFVGDLIRSGVDKVVYACALPAHQAYDLEAAYLDFCQRTYGGKPLEYVKKGASNKLSMEVTAESVPEACIIGWVTRTDIALTYHHNQNLDPSINYKALETYPRFQRWVEIIQEAGGDVSQVP